MDQSSSAFKVKGVPNVGLNVETVTFSFAKMVKAKAGRTWYLGGNAFAPNVWLTMTALWSEFVGQFLADHVERDEKDGSAFVPGGLKVGDEESLKAVRALTRSGIAPDDATGTLDRCNDGITHLSMLVLDYDKGASFDDVVDVLRGLGLEFVAYTSFSHGKSLTTLPKKHLVKFNGGENTLSLEGARGIRRYLAEQERYADDIAESAVIAEEYQDSEGVLWVDIQHEPMDKFRVVIPLAQRFACIGDASAAQRWKSKYMAFGEMIGFPFDAACAKLCQPFYFPSRPPSSPPPRIVRGRGSFLDFDEWSEEMAEAGKRVAKREAATAARAQTTAARPRTTTGAARSVVVDPSTFNTRGLQIARILAEHADSVVTKTTEAGGVVSKVSLLCPFADDHTQHRGRDTRGGAWAKNADDDSGDGIVRCSHDHCKGRNTEDFIGAWIEQGVLEPAVIPIRTPSNQQLRQLRKIFGTKSTAARNPFKR